MITEYFVQESSNPIIKHQKMIENSKANKIDASAAESNFKSSNRPAIGTTKSVEELTNPYMPAKRLEDRISVRLIEPIGG